MKVLLCNPWIIDFKAYDEWMRPYPFLNLIYKYDRIHEFKLIDCMNSVEKKTKYGTAKFKSVEIEKPSCYKQIPRKYKRYGVSIETFINEALSFGKPDIILVTSMMTYWYGGVQLAVSLLRDIYPDVPIKLGGIYANLLPKHAASIADLLPSVSHCIEHIDCKISPPSPDFSVFRGVLPVRLIKGCPDNCFYCAAGKLNGASIDTTSSLEFHIRQLDEFAKSGGRDIVFLDDAPLYMFDSILKEFLIYVINNRINVRLHFPNGIHARMITKEASTLLFTAGTKTIRLGYERNGEKKIGSFEFETAAKNLYHAGFTRSEIGAYLLVGLSDSLMDVKKDADFISKCGISVHLNQLSPVPGSRFYETVMDKHPEIEQEPLLQNDSSFIFTHLGFDYAEVAELKEYVRSLST